MCPPEGTMEFKYNVKFQGHNASEYDVQRLCGVNEIYLSGRRSVPFGWSNFGVYIATALTERTFSMSGGL